MMATYYRFRSITSTPIPTVFPIPDDVNQKTVHDPETGVSVAGTWLLYTPEETYRLYLGANSAHLEDGLARQGAELLINLKTEEETR